MSFKKDVSARDKKLIKNNSKNSSNNVEDSIIYDDDDDLSEEDDEEEGDEGNEIMSKEGEIFLHFWFDTMYCYHY